MRIAVAGAGGRMGRTLIEAVQADPAVTLGAALDAAGSPAIGSAAGTLRVGSDLEAALAASDVLIDFTRPEGTLAHVAACARRGKSIVIGTTGFSEAQLQSIREASARIAIALSPNFAVGVNVLFALAARAAKALGDEYDVEIIEAHHRHKVDAPSGTAIKLGQVIAGALARDLRQVERHGRQGDTGERPARQIGFHAVRGGDIVGEHTALFAGVGERLELTVRSQSRMTYASGAVRAAKWLKGRPAGLYDMADVLSLRA